MHALLNKGDKILILNVSKSVKEEVVDKGKTLLTEKGFIVDVASNMSSGGIFCGTKGERLKILKEAFESDEYKMVIFASGGFGNFELLDGLDFNTFKDKFFVGMSGNSIILNVIAKKTNKITCLHSNLEGLVWNSHTFENFISFFKEGSSTIIKNFDIINKTKLSEISGTAIGGNLRSIESLIGTEYEPDWKDKILFIEETERGGGDLIRAFYHLKYMGVLKKIKALVVGRINSDIEEEKMDYFYDLLKTEDLCVLKTGEFGHNCENTVIPIGGTVNINLNKRIITL